MAAQRGIANGISNEYDGVRNDDEGAVKSDDKWVNMAKGILRAEMTRRGITYEQLAAKLAEMGVADTAVNIRNKVARGGFSAAFMLQCLVAVGCQTVRLDDR
ncbi:hypothetical protein EDC65_2183 [Stella humosa]|uniref:DUF6471 domain-containing protein n=2 Tax=Stella humosa TaxID=94 RepID=A0A3N1MCF1_9PROT|nr:hypothetical protein EDC65_2183 [Stella humosa]BBK30373.1 hypothetical protein STHU_10070 [Stella humosa]